MSDQEMMSTISHRVDRLDHAHSALAQLIGDLPVLLEPITPEDDVDEEGLKGTLALVRDFMVNEVVKRTYTHAPGALRGRQPINDSFVSTVEGASLSIRNELLSQEALNVVEYEKERLKRTLRDAMDRSERTEFAFLTVPEQAELDAIVLEIRERLHSLDERFALKSATKRAKEAAASAEQSASRASSAAGVTADNVMSSFYETLGNEEQSTANLFRRWAIGLGSVAGALAWIFLSGAGLGVGWLEIAAGDYVHLMQRGLVLAAFLALAGYLARQAHQHRTMGNWARSLAVQLKTYDAFVDAIDEPAVRDELRKNFASRVFGDHPAIKGEPAISASSQGVTALTEAISKLMPAAK